MTALSNFPRLDQDFADEVTDFERQNVENQSWTKTRKVRLGVIINGSEIVRVPAADAEYQSENYFTEIDNSGYGICINERVGEDYGRIVQIGYPPDDKERIHVQKNILEPQNNPVVQEAGAQDHASQHSLSRIAHDGITTSGKVGSDIVWIDDRQLWNLAIHPHSGLQARLVPGWVSFYGKPVYVPDTILDDQTSNVPSGSGKAAYVLVEVDSALNITYTKGSEFNYLMPGASGFSQYVPTGADNTLKRAVLLRNGDTKFTYAHMWPGMHVRTVDGPPQVAITAAANTSGPGTYYVDTSSTAVTVTLATVDCVNGRRITIKDDGTNAATNNITYDTEGSELIDNAASKSITADDGFVTVEAYDSNWYVVGKG